MTPNPLRFIWKNISSVLLAVALSIAVWVSAVIASDPNEERALAQNPILELEGLSSDLAQTLELPEVVEVYLRAPKSVWDEIDLNPGLVQAKIDVTDLEEGEYELPLDIDFSITPVQLVEVKPGTAQIKLEPLLSDTEKIQPVVRGEPALGFHAGVPVLSQDTVQVSGPQSLVEKISELQVILDVTSLRESIVSDMSLTAVDDDGRAISGLTFTPSKVKVTLPIVQSGGYRDVAVKVETLGQPVSGYRVTNITISPPTVTLYSSDPQIVAEMPGYVSTQPLDLRDLDDDMEVRLTLDLPDDVTIVGGEQSVQVQVGIAAVETSISLSVPIGIIGLGTGLEAVVSPESVDIFLTGPLPILDDLTTDDIIIFVDLTDLEAGSHLVGLQVEILPERVVQEAINPDTIEVTIIESGDS
ncbi:MAG: CdaR family protein [Anaerolineales bacterium]|jgi:YbbR domain-containing protein